MSDALRRLTAAVATISAGVARIGSEVTDTAGAIRDHVTSDSGISQTTILEAVSKLEAAGSQLSAAADELDTIQSGLNAPSDVPGSDIPGSDIPGSDVPGSDVPPAVPPSDVTGSDVPGSDVTGSDVPGSDVTGSDVPGSDVPPAGDTTIPGGNPNGIGSDFETGGKPGAGLSGGEPGAEAPASDVTGSDVPRSDVTGSDVPGSDGSEQPGGVPPL